MSSILSFFFLPFSFPSGLSDSFSLLSHGFVELFKLTLSDLFDLTAGIDVQSVLALCAKDADAFSEDAFAVFTFIADELSGAVAIPEECITIALERGLSQGALTLIIFHEGPE
jgi:hypothetical protein